MAWGLHVFNQSKISKKEEKMRFEAKLRIGCFDFWLEGFPIRFIVGLA